MLTIVPLWFRYFKTHDLDSLETEKKWKYIVGQDYMHLWTEEDIQNAQCFWMVKKPRKVTST